MKKDIPHLPVTGVKLAIARKNGENQEAQWHVYIINNNQVDLDNLLITSKGYSNKNVKDGEQQKTSVLRHMIEKLKAGSYAVIEPIDPALFKLFNEFWVSYYIGKDIYDKKFVFVPESVMEKNLIPISEIGLDGVLHS